MMKFLSKKVCLPLILAFGTLVLLLLDWFFNFGILEWLSGFGFKIVFVLIALGILALLAFTLPLVWARLWGPLADQKDDSDSAPNVAPPAGSTHANHETHEHPHKKSGIGLIMLVLLVVGLLGGGYYYWATTRDIPVSQTGTGCNASGLLELPAGKRSQAIEYPVGCWLVPFSKLANAGKLELLDGTAGRWVTYSPVMKKTTGDYRKWRLTARADSDVAISFAYVPIK